MGRKALPDNVHLLNGNPSKKRFSVLSDGARIPVEIPDAPKHLTNGAKVEWRKISAELEKLGLVSKIDRAALAVYCQAYDRWAQAETELKKLGIAGLVEKTPSGYQQISVLLQISNRAVEQMHKFLGEFGMTPSARSKVNINMQADLFGDDKNKQQPSANPAAKYFRPK